MPIPFHPSPSLLAACLTLLLADPVPSFAGPEGIPHASAPRQQPASTLSRSLPLPEGQAILQVTGQQLVEAVKMAVAANPKVAATILTEVFSLPRKDIPSLAGDLLGAALGGLGPKPAPAMVKVLVRLAVELQPKAIVPILQAAIKTLPNSMAMTVVKSALAAIPDPSPALIDQIVATVIAAQQKKPAEGPEAALESAAATEESREQFEKDLRQELAGPRDEAQMMMQAGARSIPPIPPSAVDPTLPPGNPRAVSR